MGLSCTSVLTGLFTFALAGLTAGCSPSIVEVAPGSPLYVGPIETPDPPPSEVPAPYAPAALSCDTAPLGKSAGNICALTPAIPADPQGRFVTYVDGGSSCPEVSVNSATGTVSFTAPVKYAGCVIAVKANNGSTLSPAVVSDTITGQNNAPATPGSISCPLSPIAGTTGVSCTLVATSPADIDGDPVTYSDNGSSCSSISINPSNGSATFTAPAKGSTCIVRVRAHDGTAYSSAVSSEIITGASQPPNTPTALSCVVNPLAQSTGNACTLTPASPVDNDGDPVTYFDGGSSCAGVSVNSTTGDATFTAPDKGASCVVKVRAYDGAVYSIPVSSATITGINNAPSVPSSLSCATTPLGGSTGNACTLTAATPADIDGDSVTYSDNGSTCASVSVNGTTGSATFTAPASGATCVVKVRASDGTAFSGAVSSATITGQNNAPNSPASISCITTPVGGSAGNSCTLTAASPLDPDGGSVTYSDGGSTCTSVVVNATTGSATFTAPAKGATCVVKIRAYDGLTYSSATSSAVITGQNNAPSQPASLSCPANPPAGSAGNSCTLVAAAPADPDNDSVTYVNDASTCTVTSVDSSTGAVIFTAPAVGANCTVRVKAFDGAAYSAAVVATIGGANNAPSAPAAVSCITTPFAKSTGNACTLTAAVPADSDGDSVTYSDGSSTCAGVSVNATTGAAIFTAPDKNASCVIKIRAYDGQAYSSATSSATITGQNNAPNTPAALSCATTPAGGSSGNTCTLTAATPVDLDGDAVTYSDNGSTCSATSVNGTTGNSTFTAPASGGTCTVKVRAHDGTAYSGTVSSATITAQNNAPNTPASLVCVTTPVAGSAGNACTLTAASPADPDGQSVTYSDGGSTCAAVVVNATTGNATFTAPLKNATCVVKVRAYDGAAYSTAISSATITGQNRLPWQPGTVSCTTNPAAQSTGNTCTLTPTSPADPDGDAVTYSDDASTCAAVSINATTGNATFTAPAKGATCVVRVRAHDGTAYSTLASASGTITGQNRAPNTPTSLGCTTNPQAGSVSHSCTLTAASPADPDGDPVTYSNDGSTCPAVSVNSSTGNATFTAPAKNATCVVKVRAYDGTSYSSAVSSATITGQNNAPNIPASISCNTTPLGGSTGNTCTLTAASPVDVDGDSVTYANAGSTCGAVSVTAGTGAVTFTAPAKTSTCLIKVRAYDGTAYSSVVTSATITGQNNPPSIPISLVCPATPAAGSTGNTCTLTAASPADLDGDTVTYANDGSTCGAASVSTNGATITFTAPATGATCVMKVRAHDGTVYSSAVSSATITGTMLCPANFIRVPGNATYGTSDFCVAKFPMKGVDGSGNLVNGGEGSGIWQWVLNGCEDEMESDGYYDCYYFTPITIASTYAASRPDGTPWVAINRDDAAAKCASMGAGYHLITNAEWQTIARNVENRGSNWISGSVGGFRLNRGHSDDAIDGAALGQGFAYNGASSFDAGIRALASCGGVNCATVAFNDSSGYAGTGNSSGSGWEQKRTHTLSNGEVIWDFAGNVWQWVADNNTNHFESSQFISQLTAVSNPVTGTIGSLTGNAKFLFGTAGDFSGLGFSDNYGGLGYLASNNSGAIIRGGGWSSTWYAGVFSADLSVWPTRTDTGVGFRCAK